jgi:hypothetical protein
MPPVTRHGTIELIAGVMFSGKSEELIRRVRRAIIAKRAVQVFKSHLDARYAGLFHVSSHDGREVEAVPIDFDQAAWQETFLRQWPEGSDAWRSYHGRIVNGPSYRREQALRSTAALAA